MKRISTIVLLFFMVLALSLNLVGCDKTDKESGAVSAESKSEESKKTESKAAESKAVVTLVQKYFDCVGLKVPSDFGDFKDGNDGKTATNADSTASIFISNNLPANHRLLYDITEDSYKQSFISGYSNVNFAEFKNNVHLTHADAAYAHFTAKNSDGAEVEVYSYLIWVEVDDGDDEFIHVLFAFNKNADSSLKASIDEVVKSVDFSYDFLT